MKKSANIVFLIPLVAPLLFGCGGGDSSAPDTSSSGPISAVSGDSGVESAATEESYEDQVWTGSIKIYYHNDAGDYATKRIWAWASGVDGAEYEFDNQTSASEDSYGLYKVFDLSQAPWFGNVTTTFSFIIKTASTWSGQSTDTIIPFGKFAPYAVDNMITVYACDGEGGNIDTFAKKEDAMGDRIASANFTDWKNIHLEGSGIADGRESQEVGKFASYRLYAYDNAYYRMSDDDKAAHKADYLIQSGDVDSQSLDIALAEEAKPYLAYTVEARMKSDPSRSTSKVVGCTALFDTDTFKTQYTYTGHDLGTTSTHESTIFKVWAPTSSRVQVKLFMVGTPADLIKPFDASRNWGKAYDMNLGEQGVWQLEIKQDLIDDPDYPYYYTYLVTNSMGTNEVCDPYAKATGINGRRAAIMDWSRLETENPENWDNVDSYDEASLLSKVDSPNQLSVYEAHIADLTGDDTWISNEGNKRTTYNAFSESGTTYSIGEDVVKTGRDNISECKFNAVQLMPVFDSDNDEMWLDEDGNSVDAAASKAGEGVEPAGYNWGYNPLNYNVVEGIYSSDPYTPKVRISEFKNLVKSYAEDGIRIIMDVVYNHVSSVNSSAFTKLVPFYYFRTDSNGYYTNGTGCGNEVATERPMMSSFIVDSLCWWAKEYKIKGFRFDVMGCIDCATLKAASKALYAIDPNIVMYGEGWTADGSYAMTNKTGKRAVAASCYSTLYPGQDDCPIGVGCFNSVGKEALKGEEHLGWGFMNRGSDYNDGASGIAGIPTQKVTYMMNGHMWNGSDLDYSNPTQTVNYASCHDNYTNYDQFNYTVGTGPSSAADSTVAMEASAASIASILFSEGIAFTQGGEEIFRQKLLKEGDEYYEKIVEDDYVALGDGTKLVRNSYAYGGECNYFKWDRKVTYFEQFAKIRDAGIARAKVCGEILGRHYDGTSQWGAQGISGWNDTISHGCGIAYQTEDTYYYGFLIGRLNASDYGSSGGVTNIGIGNGTLEIVYDSYGRTGNISVTDYKLAAYQNEFLLVKVVA